jgi:tRNA wybutosine-synthesizing protein 1
MSCSGETIESDNEIIQIKPMILSQLKKAKYGVSDHATVELCHWTKKSFKNEGDCYKMKFYGITTHRCMEFSPAGMYCENRCIYCWRPMEFYNSMEMPENKVAEPEVVVANLMEERKKLIMGHYGDPKQD